MCCGRRQKGGYRLTGVSGKSAVRLRFKYVPLCKYGEVAKWMLCFVRAHTSDSSSTL